MNFLRIISVLLLAIAFIDAHGHSHDHENDEPAHFKYSRQANEQFNAKAGDDEVDHDDDHSHDTPHAHSHSHDAHTDSLKPPPSHSHSHSPPPSHSHSHDAPPSHSHSHDAPPSHSHSHDAPSADSHKSDEVHHDHSHEKHGHSHDSPKSSGDSKSVKPKSSDYSMWLKAVAATGLISAAPVIILWFIPLDKTNKHESLLKILLSFASGGLLGDAFLHLIPHAIAPHDHSSEHSHSHSHGSGEAHDHSEHMMVGLWVVAGIIIFLCVEKFVRYVKGGHGHSHHSHADTKPAKEGGKSDAKSSKDKGQKSKKKPDEDIKVSGYLNLAADFAHNFTDGLAIGASFLVGNNVGIVTTITILFHEIPHEIGDFAILIQSGCTKKRAMFLQLTTAVGAMMGTLCSLMAQGAGQAATSWILPFTAGGFIYIATVSVIPELLGDSKPGQSVLEILAMLVGIGMMIVIALYE